jgi:hypothetical protein
MMPGMGIEPMSSVPQTEVLATIQTGPRFKFKELGINDEVQRNLQHVPRGQL